jgi:hypothetical protein
MIRSEIADAARCSSVRFRPRFHVGHHEERLRLELAVLKDANTAGRSVKIMRPSGAHTIDHSTSRLPTTVSTLNLVCVCGELSISPAPRPGAGWLHESAIEIRRSYKDHFPFFICHFSFFIHSPTCNEIPDECPEANGK